MPLFRDIPQLTRSAKYAVDVSWSYLTSQYYSHVTEYGLDVYPDFQRAYVWTPEQKVRYVEFILRGGTTGRDIYTNCPTWNQMLGPRDYVLVDGRQRLDAVLGFMNNEFPIFGGSYRRDYTDTLRLTQGTFRWHVNDLATRDEVLQWYVDLNAGGTIHTPDEINRVRALMGEGGFVPPSPEEVLNNARIDREIFREVVRKEEEQNARRAAAPPPVQDARSRRKSRG